MSITTIEHLAPEIALTEISTLHQVSYDEIEELSVLMNCLKPAGTPVEPLSRSWVDRVVMSEDRDIVVARSRHDQQILGTLTLNAVMEPTQSGSYAHIGGVVVHPEARGQRLTSRMLRFSESWAIARGLSTLRLFTEADRVPAIRAYESWGARQEETNSQGEPRVFYVKRLS